MNKRRIAYRSESGQGLVEVSLGIVLVGLVTIVTVAVMGDSIADTYCTVTESMSDIPNEACYEALAGQEGDGPIVFKPRYKSSRGDYILTAKLLTACTGSLTVVGYGTMDQHGDSDLHSLNLGSDEPPDQLTVGSDTCGWTTVNL